MADTEGTPRAGFQSSETTGAEVTFYSNQNDPILIESMAAFTTEGRRQSDFLPGLMSVETQKVLGGGAGTWAVTLKPTYEAEQILNQVADDDWVDIVLTRKGKRFHVMRGLVDEVRENKTVGGTGATTTTFTISGRDHQKVFEQTYVWFNIHNAENVAGSASLKMQTLESLRGPPDEVVRQFLFDMLQELEGKGRANWVLPDSMPGLSVSGGSFVDNVSYETFDFSGEPLRIGIDPNWAMPQGTVWDLAQEWADPLFCELFCDLWNSAALPPEQGEENLIDKSKMVVVMRDRPFPFSTKSSLVSGDGTSVGLDSTWFTLPLFVIPQQWLVATDLGRSSYERYNAFFAAPQVIQEAQQDSIDLTQPLWNPDDIARHGFRRLDIQTRYTSQTPGNLLGMAASQRERARDWHMLNPYYRQGSLALGLVVPELRVGSRVRVPGRGSVDQDQTFYVEQVGHSWQFGAGGRTNLGVTRGWVGTDASLVDALDLVAGSYKTPAKALP